ncbi:ATP-binding protein [Pseudarthrobacter sulfonivorans]|uniref:ATP-binding protein n=1 Tax=Pseudarthrobacter sulfonivorans TaxID=121292 RepID=UPI00285A7A67|nr:ATP-binding protein [Pseudarthrobacter sulfonivorans]MDR6414595.1 signal transduction histidine kinase [Pseudarthrobacter sulfonivorans]
MPYLAVVADPDAGRRGFTAATLEAAGFMVRTAGSAAGLTALLGDGEPSVLVLDSSLSDVDVSAPVLVLVDLDSPAEVKAVEHAGVRDCVAKPPAAKELVHRATALINLVSRRTEARQEAETLRERLRQVSAAIRGTNDPQQIADFVVKGFGETFGADRVWLTTFDDYRVPLITAQWHRSRLAPLPATLFADAEQARTAADLLWAQSESLTAEGAFVQGGSGDVAQPAELAALGAAASVAVPMGEGSSSLGIIWIALLDSPREWSRTELGLIQHVAGNAAHGLIQSHLITSQQQVVKQLQQLDKAKTDFLATVNHELRTPLTSIMAYLDMIQENTSDPVSNEVHQMLDIVVRNTERLRLLIEDMLSVSRNGHELSPLQLTPFRLDRTLEIVTAALTPLAKLQNVTILLAPSADNPEIMADEVQLQQVFTNLVSNAIKFTPSGGRIDVTSVSCTETDGTRWATVSVSDTGMGISSDEIAHVFTRFYRASNAMSGAVPGTGLGLAITQDIVDRHGGRIDVASELGLGTTVTVKLPLAAHASQNP